MTVGDASCSSLDIRALEVQTRYVTIDLARQLFESGRAHALASDLLYRSAILHAEQEQIEDIERFAFNGTFSLSTHYLLGLGLELMLKAAMVASGGPSDEKSLRAIGHDLVKALDSAEAAGFNSEAPNLRGIVDVMSEPFKEHWFRYGRPNNFELPGNWIQVVEALEVLDAELGARLWENE